MAQGQQDKDLQLSVLQRQEPVLDNEALKSKPDPAWKRDKKGRRLERAEGDSGEQNSKTQDGNSHGTDVPPGGHGGAKPKQTNIPQQGMTNITQERYDQQNEIGKMHRVNNQPATKRNATAEKVQVHRPFVSTRVEQFSAKEASKFEGGRSNTPVETSKENKTMIQNQHMFPIVVVSCDGKSGTEEGIFCNGLGQFLRFVFVTEDKKKLKQLSMKTIRGVTNIEKWTTSKLVLYLNEEQVNVENVLSDLCEILRKLSSDVMASTQETDDASYLCDLAKQKIKECKNETVLLHQENKEIYWVCGYTSEVTKVIKHIDDLKKATEKSNLKQKQYNRDTAGLETNEDNKDAMTEPGSVLRTTKESNIKQKDDVKEIHVDQGLNVTYNASKHQLGNQGDISDINQEMENKTEKELPLSLLDRDILNKFGIAHTAVIQSLEVKIENLNSGLLLSGKECDVEMAASKFKTEIEAIKKNRKVLDLKPLCREMMLSKECYAYVQDYLRHHKYLLDIKENEIYVYAESSKHVDNICSTIKKRVVQKEIDDISAILWKSEPFATEVHNLEVKYPGKLRIAYDDRNRCVVVVGTDSIIPYIVKHIQQLAMNLTKPVSETFIAAELQIKYFRKYQSLDFRNIAKLFQVKIEAFSKQNLSGWTLKGACENVRLAKIEMEKCFQEVKCGNVYIECRDSTFSFENKNREELRRFILETENTYECTVGEKKCLFIKKTDTECTGNEQLLAKKWIYENGRMIGLVCNEDPSCWAEIYVIHFPESKKKGLEENITYSTEKDNKIWVPVPIWKGGKQQEKEKIRTRLGEVFSYLVEQNISSICFPFEIHIPTGWHEIVFLKQVLYAFDKCNEGAFATLKCFFVHPSNNQCYHAMAVIEEFLKKDLENGKVQTSPSSFKWTENEQGCTKICIKVRKGQLVEQKANVLVNTTSKELKLNSGAVSGSILKAAGDEIQQECLQFYPKGVKHGQIAVTDGYKLKCNKVYHGALPGYNESTASLESFVKKCLKNASDSRFQTICFPALGTGNLGYPKDVAAKAMFDAAEAFESSGENRTLTNVDFVIYPGDQGSVKAFEGEERRRCETAKKLSDADYMKDFCLRFDDGKAMILSVGDVLHQDLPVDGMVVFWDKQYVCGDPGDIKPYLKQAGESFKKEWSKKGKSLPTNKYDLTSAGNLPCSKIVHYITDIDSGNLGILGVFEKSFSESLESLIVPVLQTDFDVANLKRFASSLYKAFHAFVKKFKLEDMLIVKIVTQNRGLFITMKEELIKLHPPDVSTAGVKMCRGYRFSVVSCDQANIDKAVEQLKRNFSDSAKPVVEEVTEVDKKEQEPPKVSQKKKFKWNQLQDPKTSMSSQDYDTQQTPLHNASIKTEENLVQMEKTNLETCRLKFRVLDEGLLSKGPSHIKRELKDHFYDLHINPIIVFPSGVSHQGFLKFFSSKDAADFLDKCNHNKYSFLTGKYEFENFPAQVLVNMYAELSVEIAEQLSKKDFEELQRNIENKSGAVLVQRSGLLGLEGTLTDIDVAQQYLSEYLAAKDTKYHGTDGNFENLNGKSFVSKQVPVFGNVKEDHSDKSSVPDSSDILGDSPPAIPPHKKKSSQPTVVESRQMKPVQLSKEEYEMMMETNPEIFQQNSVSISVVDSNIVIVTGEELPLSKVQTAQTDLLQMQKDEVTDLTDTEMKKAAIAYNELRKKYPDVYVRQLNGEWKVKIFGKTYTDVIAVKTALLIATERQKETGRGKRNFANPTDQVDGGSDLAQAAAVSSFVQKGEKIYETNEGIAIYVYTGDILYLQVDCIVNASNTRLEHRHGIAGDIAKAAGDVLVQECRNYVCDKDRVPVGGTVVTSSGNLQHYKCIIHAVGPHWDHYEDKSLVKDELVKTVLGCFYKVTENKLHSVALPAISSGIFQVPLEQCVEAYVESVQKFSRTIGSDTSLREIHFVALDPNITQLIESGFQSLRPPTGKIAANPVTKEDPLRQETYPVMMQVVHDQRNQLIQKFLFGPNLNVNICTGDILEFSVHAVVSSENEEFCGQGQIASMLLNKGGKKYKAAHEKLKKSKGKLGDVRHTDTGVQNVMFVLHAVMPAWTSEMTINSELKKGYFDTLFGCINNILGHADNLGVESIAFPLFGSGGHNADLNQLCKTLGRALLKFGRKHEARLKYIYVVNIHDWLAGRITSEFQKLASVSSTTKQNLSESYIAAVNSSRHDTPMEVDSGSIVEGPQPKGTFRVTTKPYIKLPGHEGYGTIEIQIFFESGKQTVGHPNPGKPYESCLTVTYLPDSPKGKKLEKLLQVAFDRKLLFKVIHCNEKMDKITRNQIHLKTNIHGGMQNNGYPDETYLSYLEKKLKEFGVTDQKDLMQRETTI